MPYEMSWESRGVCRRYFGRTSDWELSESVYKTQSSPRFDELRFVILDFSDVSGFKVSNPAFIDETAAIDSAASNSNPNIKIAIVATAPEIIKLAEAYAAHDLTPYPTRIFSSMEDARRWATVNQPWNKHLESA